MGSDMNISGSISCWYRCHGWFGYMVDGWISCVTFMPLHIITLSCILLDGYHDCKCKWSSLYHSLTYIKYYPKLELGLYWRRWTFHSGNIRNLHHEPSLNARISRSSEKPLALSRVPFVPMEVKLDIWCAVKDSLFTQGERWTRTRNLSTDLDFVSPVSTIRDETVEFSTWGIVFLRLISPATMWCIVMAPGTGVKYR